MCSTTSRSRSAASGVCGSIRCLLAALLLTVVAPTEAQEPPRDPRGVVGQPRLDSYTVSPARDARFLFQGRVDFPGQRGRVRIDVLNDGNGDANDALNWTIEVATGVIEDIPILIDDEEWFAWSTQEPVAIFQDNDVTQERWPEGGTARIRFVAVRQNPDGSEDHALLAVLDKQQLEGLTTDLIVADDDPRPTSRGRSNPDYLNKKPALGRDETARYYFTVRTGPNGTTGNSIAAAVPTLSRFVERYLRRADEFALAVYYNHGDLGIGRFMRCGFRAATQETACAVENYGRRDGTAAFGNFGESFEATRFGDPFATVAMVERGLMQPGAPNKVFFVVYDARGRLALEAPLDNKGFNKFIPGNCLVCHGSGGSFTRAQPVRCPAPFPRDAPFCNRSAAEVRGAYFLPFDLSSFRFFGKWDNVGDIVDWTREGQERSFKALNRIVARTDLQRLPHAKELLEGWYGGPGFPRASFDDAFVPSGWNQDANIRKLYHEVIAKTCRGCHISHPGPFAFQSLEQFSMFKATVHLDICKLYSMPNAEQTQDIFWRGSARSHLLNRLPIQFGCGLPPPTLARAPSPAATPPTPGRAPSPVTPPSTPRRAPTTAEDVRALSLLLESYKLQNCSCKTRQCLDLVEEQFLGDIAALSPVGPSAAAMIDPLIREAIECRARFIEEN